eukprot:scaffold259919_cov31-Tisochrysis_lutea.AAC.3
MQERTKRLETLREILDHLLYERLHRRDVHNLEGVEIDRAVGASVHTNLMQKGQHRHVGLARAGGCANEHAFGREKCAVVYPRLHAVQS